MGAWSLDRLAPAPEPGDSIEAWGPLRRGDDDLNPGAEMGRDRPPVPAAVLVPLVDRQEGMTVLLTRRTEHLDDHAGQISFPGGRIEAGDDGAVAAALRETEEEIGLDRRFVEVVGRLDTYRTVTGFAVLPVVGVVAPGFSLRLDRFEVAEAFEVPFDFVVDPANHRRHTGVIRGVERHWYAIPYGERYIWGATAGMLVDLSQKLGAGG